MLRKNGYDELQFVESAEEAYELLGITKNDSGAVHDTALLLDLILMDRNMLGDNGIEACKRIKAVAGFADIPIIMLTANN